MKATIDNLCYCQIEGPCRHQELCLCRCHALVDAIRNAEEYPSDECAFCLKSGYGNGQGHAENCVWAALSKVEKKS